jgi:dTMP kinase
MMINGYLTGQAQQDDHAIHLIFSANRWEAAKGIKEDITKGITVIVDRYSYSGAVYSAAKDNPELSLEWAWLPEIGLPSPDITLFLDISSEDAAKRGGYGEERYETEKMQSRVRTLFNELFSRITGLNLCTIDAGRTFDEVRNDILRQVLLCNESIQLKGSLQPLGTLKHRAQD